MNKETKIAGYGEREREGEGNRRESRRDWGCKDTDRDRELYSMTGIEAERRRQNIREITAGKQQDF